MHQCHTAADTEIRDDLTIIMVKRLDDKKLHQLLPLGYRRKKTAHSVDSREWSPRTIYMVRFTCTITTSYIVVWLISISIPPNYGAPFMMVSLASLISMLIFKPYIRWRPTA